MMDLDKAVGKSGYMGQDSMRDKAKSMLGKEMSDTTMSAPKSFGAADNEKMRVYKKGGHVKHTSDMRRAVKGRSKMETPKLNIESMKEAECMGKPRSKLAKYAMGGVGKIRHKEATPSGMPIKKKTKK